MKEIKAIYKVWFGFVFEKQNVFNSKVFPLFWNYVFPVSGIKCNSCYEVIIRVDSSVIGGSNVLT